MVPIEALLRELDRSWKPLGDGKVPLDVIGSGALMLQADYIRATKDGDILEVQTLSDPVKRALLALAGKGSALHARFGIYLDIVLNGLPFLPHPPLFHPAQALTALEHFQVRALDIVDVAVSKLIRFNRNDQSDIRAMADRRLLDHARLVERFKLAVDGFSLDARAEDLPRYISNLHMVERDHLAAPESRIDLPDWLKE